MSAVEIIDSEVRELIRRRGLDPWRDPGQIGSLVDEVLADYEDRALSSALPAVGDPGRPRAACSIRWPGSGRCRPISTIPRSRRSGSTSRARCSSPVGRSELTTTVLGGGQIADLVERMLRTSGRRLDLSTPFVDALLPDGSRLHVVIPDITRRHLALNIRKFMLQAHSLEELITLGSLTAHAARFLEAAVAAGLNIIVSGGTQAGKTRLLNCLSAAVPARERVVSCEEVFELRLHLRDWVAMQTRQPNLEGTGRSRCAGS